MTRELWFAALLLAGCGSNVDAPAPSAPSCGTASGEGVVVTDQGAVRGMSTGGIWSFLGVPYAAPPKGGLRFAAPAPYGCFDGVRPAQQFGAECPQSTVDKDGKPNGVTGDEDCLTLNVWTPAADGAARPVMVFIHGGGNVQGSSSVKAADGSYLYDGAVLSREQHAVVVTLNYRVGLLGWLVHDALAAESGHAASGNYGLADQLFALGWVKRNIAAFGGDPARVLVFGESAGAVNTCNLVASPLAAGLFRAAIAESGVCAAKTKDQLAGVTGDLLKASKCDGADPIGCLRKIPAGDLVAALPFSADIAGIGKIAPGPVVDGYALPDQPIALLAKAHNHVPMVFGVNSEETGRVTPAIPDEKTFDAALLDYLSGNAKLAATVKAAYPVSDYNGSYRQAFVALTSDAKFVCSSRRGARALDAGQDEPVYRYFFTHHLDNAPVVAAFGAFHGLELTFVFHHLNVSGYKPSAAEDALAQSIGGYWSRMAAAGDPNGGSAVKWPVLDAADSYLGLDDTIAAGKGLRTKQCDFWDPLSGP